MIDPDEQKQTAPPNAEQAADLAALQFAAAGAPLPVTVTATEQAPKIDLAAELAGLMALTVGTIGPMFPSLRTIYTDDTMQAASAAIASVCNKHGWMQDGVGGRFGEEIAAAFVLGPLAWATYAGIKGDLAAMARDKKPEAAQIAMDGAPVNSGAGDGSPHVTIGGQVVATAGAS